MAPSPSLYRDPAPEVNAKPPCRRCGPLARRSPPSTAHQVDVRARLEERIGRRLDAVDPRNGIEDDLPLRRRVVRNDRRQAELSEHELPTTLRPADGRIVHDVALFGQLHDDAEPD